ncbi:MAG: acyltransferase [Candidatus Goldbacteria bacterium]|nr:acyltransferase [Candidatus Goldiibacteriota bacterium]
MNYSRGELEKLGLKKIGKNVSIARSCVIINPQYVSVGDNSRIDVFCILSAGSGGIEIGSNVHIGAGAYIFGGGGRVVLSDFCGISSKCVLYTSNDDYTQGHLTNPTVPGKFKKTESGPVILKKHAGTGSGCVILPNVTMGTGSGAGALTLIRKDVPDYFIVAGNPPKKVAERDRQLLEKLEREYLEYNKTEGL